MNKLIKYSILVANILLFSQTVSANVGLNQTRVIIDQKDNNASIIARNNNDSPYLVMNFITDKVDSQKALEDKFIITPSLFRLDANSQNIIKIQVIGNSFPQDRESMFYLHSRNIPSSKEKQKGMQIGLENVIKVFYRPSSLKMDSKEAYRNLDITSTATGIKVSNNSPYYINLHKVSINNEKIEIGMKLKNNIIEPYSFITYPTQQKSGVFKWYPINELGGADAFTKQIK